MAESKPIKPEPSDKRKRILALIMLVTYAALQVLAAQFSSMAFISGEKFRAPYLFTEFKLLFRAMAFPMYLIINTIIKLIKGRKLNFRRTFRRSTGGFMEKGQTWQRTVIKFAPVVVVGLTFQTTFTLATAYIPTSAATALYSVAVEVSYVLSWLVLKHKLLLVKSVFVMVSFAGVALIGYASFDSAPQLTEEGAIYIGVACGLAAAVSLSCYQLLFKKAFPKADLGQTALLVTVLHIAQAVLFLPVPIILKLTNVEVYDIEKMPYGLLLPSWTAFGSGTMVYTYGLVLSSPFFMSIAELLNLSANTVIDPLFRGFDIVTEQIIGTCLIAVAFVVMIMPDHIVSVRLKRAGKGGLPVSESTAQIVNDTELGQAIDEETLPTSENILSVPADLDIEESESLDSVVDQGYVMDKY